MTSISSVNTQVFNSAGVAVTASGDDSGKPATTGTSAARIDGPRIAPGGQAGAAGGTASTSDDSDSVTVKALKQQIERLQKQLAAQMQQLKALQASQMEDRAKAAAVAGMQAQVSNTQAALQTAMGKLAEVLLKESGSASGSMVNTTA